MWVLVTINIYFNILCISLLYLGLTSAGSTIKVGTYTWTHAALGLHLSFLGCPLILQHMAQWDCLRALSWVPVPGGQFGSKMILLANVEFLSWIPIKLNYPIVMICWFWMILTHIGYRWVQSSGVPMVYWWPLGLSHVCIYMRAHMCPCMGTWGWWEWWQLFFILWGPWHWHWQQLWTLSCSYLPMSNTPLGLATPIFFMGFLYHCSLIPTDPSDKCLLRIAYISVVTLSFPGLILCCAA